ncbi:hypothetical protein MIS45_09115 [Wielerella bovis]|uniref:hypothetical protein n=1 Tax=Wielerella bovis TaxID=2917790 RepID=UPI0020199C74|nr:hypothetical protein [Wielerella bovis]ULJ68918.1 hypothetical protein MIS45_09115 [Wielerella bovis]
MEKTFIFLFKVYLFVMFCYSFHLIVLGWYVYPKLGIYFSQDSSRIKTACVGGFINSKWNAIIIDGKKYYETDVFLYTTPFFEVKELFPISKNNKRAMLESDVKSDGKKCYLIKYVSIIDLGFWKKFYIYDYIQD